MLWKVTKQHIRSLIYYRYYSYYRYTSMPTLQEMRNNGELELLFQSCRRTMIMY